MLLNHPDEAARIFDKAAIRIRFDKARLNFHLKDYVDECGNVLPDPQVEALLLEVRYATHAYFWSFMGASIHS